MCVYPELISLEMYLMLKKQTKKKTLFWIINLGILKDLTDTKLVAMSLLVGVTASWGTLQLFLTFVLGIVPV